MQIKVQELTSHLSRGVQSLYVVHGDEPLLALEAADAIRTAARAAGAADREVLVVEPGFKWDAFLGANANASLFGDRKVVDLRIPSGKPGAEGAKALEAYAANPNPDNITLVSLPRIDRATQSSGWFAALSEAGVNIAVYPIERDALPGGSRRASRARSSAPRARRSRFSPTRARATSSRRARRSRSSRYCSPKASSIMRPWRPPSRTSRASTCSSCPKHGSRGMPRAPCESCARCSRKAIRRRFRSGSCRRTSTRSRWSRRWFAAGLRCRPRSATRACGASGSRRSSAPSSASHRRPSRRLLVALARLDALAKGIGVGNAWDELETLALTLACTGARK